MIRLNEIIVYNSIGQIVLKTNSAEKNSLSLLNLQKGIYFIEFLKEKKRIVIKKVIKE